LKKEDGIGFVPKYKKNDKPVLDRGQSEQTLKVAERRSAKAVSYLAKKPKLRLFRNLATGEVVQRLRCSKGYERVYATVTGLWQPGSIVVAYLRRGFSLFEPLVSACTQGGPKQPGPCACGYNQPTCLVHQARRGEYNPARYGRDMLEFQKVTRRVANRAKEEVNRHAPYLVRRVMNLALSGADIRGVNDPEIREFAELILGRINRVAETLSSLGPKFESDVRRRFAQEIYRLEMESAKWKRGAWRGRVVTNDFKGDNREPGPVATLLRNGQVRLADYGVWTAWHNRGGNSWVRHAGAVEIDNLKTYATKRTLLFKSGKKRRVDCQQSPQTNRRGRKPLGARAMTGAERRMKSYYAKKSQALPPKERHQPGIVAPPPLGPAVPGPYSESDQMTKRFLENLYERIGEVLARLEKAPPDHIVCGTDLQILAMATVIYRNNQLH